MSDGTTIEWVVALARATGRRADVWNPQEGCSRAGPGCDNCWAAREVHIRGRQKGAKIAARFGGLTTVTKNGAVAFNGTVRKVEGEMEKPLREKSPTVYFVCSRSDLFHEKVSDNFRDRVFASGNLTDRHIYIYLTKRPRRLVDYIDPWLHCPMTRDNVLFGATVCNQAEADEARPLLAVLAAAGGRTWVSYEPALGPIDWTGWDFLKQIVFGGESGQGPGVRAAHPDWARAARDFCAPRGIAYFHKQWGEWLPVVMDDDGKNSFIVPDDGGDAERLTLMRPRKIKYIDGRAFCRVGKKRAGAILDGHEHREVPG